jgi:uncharacterized protein (DUF58 family)
MNFFQRKKSASQQTTPLFDEAFMRRLERLNFRTAPALRGDWMGEHRSRNLRPTLDFSNHRPYTPGDDLRHVDWTAYARHEELFVKLGEATQSVNIHILLDHSLSMACPTTPGTHSAKWLAASRLAGALSYLSLSGGEQLSLTPFAANLADGFGPTHGKRRAIAALQFLTDLKPAPAIDTGAGLGHCLTRYARTHPTGGLLIIISDLLDTVDTGAIANFPSPLAELTDGLSSLSPPRWQTVVIHLLTEQELNPTPIGNIDLQDIETGQNLPFRLDESTLGQYRLRVRSWQKQVERICTQRSAAYAQIQAEWPLEQAILPYLRQRRVMQ